MDNPPKARTAPLRLPPRASLGCATSCAVHAVFRIVSNVAKVIANLSGEIPVDLEFHVA